MKEIFRHILMLKCLITTQNLHKWKQTWHLPILGEDKVLDAWTLEPIFEKKKNFFLDHYQNDPDLSTKYMNFHNWFHHQFFQVIRSLNSSARNEVDLCTKYIKFR